MRPETKQAARAGFPAAPPMCRGPLGESWGKVKAAVRLRRAAENTNHPPCITNPHCLAARALP